MKAMKFAGSDSHGIGVERSVALVVLLLLVMMSGRVWAQSNQCPTDINGARKGEPGNIQDNTFHSLAIDPGNENIVYVGTETSGIFKTTDGGLTWKRLRSGFMCTQYQTGYPQIFDITIDPTNRNTVYASTVNGPGPANDARFPSSTAGVYKSTNGGLTWSQKISGFTNTYATYVLVDSTNPQKLYAAIGGVKSTFSLSPNQFFEGGVLTSTDGGESWSPLTMPVGFSSNVIADMVIRGADQRHLYATGQVHRNDAPVAYGLVKSTDAGTTWQVINPPGIIFYSFDVFRQDPNLIYANDTTSSRKVWKSTDGGATWTRINTASFYGEIRIHPTNSQIIFYTGTTSIMRSTNGLQTSTAVFTDAGLDASQQMMDIEISLSNPNVVWACAKGYYIYKSTDGGNSFTKISAIRDSVYQSVTEAETAGSDRPELRFDIEQNYPNPFSARGESAFGGNPTTAIVYQVPVSSHVTMEVFDLLGRRIAILVDEDRGAGEHRAIWNARDMQSKPVSSGVYVYRLTTGSLTLQKRMVLVR